MKKYETPEIDVKFFDVEVTAEASGTAHKVVAGLNGVEVVQVSFQDIIAINSSVE